MKDLFHFFRNGKSVQAVTYFKNVFYNMPLQRLHRLIVLPFKFSIVTTYPSYCSQ